MIHVLNFSCSYMFKHTILIDNPDFHSEQVRLESARNEKVKPIMSVMLSRLTLCVDIESFACMYKQTFLFPY